MGALLVGGMIILAAGGALVTLAVKVKNEAEEEELDREIFLEKRVKSLRPRIGERILVYDGTKRVAEGILLEVEEAEGIAYVDIRTPPDPNPPVRKDIAEVELANEDIDFYDSENDLI